MMRDAVLEIITERNDLRVQVRQLTEDLNVTREQLADEEVTTTRLRAELAALREATRWIPVGERLPLSCKAIEMIVHVHLDRNYWWFRPEGPHIYGLPLRFGVAWRPLPASPEVS